MARLIDVSMMIYTGMMVWPGDDGVDLHRVQRMEDGAHSNLSRISCGVHTGTHVDAPFHFIPGGKTIEQLPLEALIGPAWVAEFPEIRRIGAEELQSAGIPRETTRLLMKTVNSKTIALDTVFREDYAGLTESGAKWILERGIRLVGNDYLSVACRDQTGPVHTLLLGAGILFVEGLNLNEVPPGACRFYCLPLKLKGSDGGLARAAVEIR